MKKVWKILLNYKIFKTKIFSYKKFNLRYVVKQIYYVTKDNLQRILLKNLSLFLLILYQTITFK